MSQAPRKVQVVFLSMTNTHCQKTLRHKEALCKGDSQSFWLIHISPWGTFMLHPLSKVWAVEPHSLTKLVGISACRDLWGSTESTAQQVGRTSQERGARWRHAHHHNTSSRLPSAPTTWTENQAQNAGSRWAQLHSLLDPGSQAPCLP